MPTPQKSVQPSIAGNSHAAATAATAEVNHAATPNPSTAKPLGALSPATPPSPSPPDRAPRGPEPAPRPRRTRPASPRDHRARKAPAPRPQALGALAPRLATTVLPLEDPLGSRSYDTLIFAFNGWDCMSTSAHQPRLDTRSPHVTAFTPARNPRPRATASPRSSSTRCTPAQSPKSRASADATHLARAGPRLTSPPAACPTAAPKRSTGSSRRSAASTWVPQLHQLPAPHAPRRER